MVGFERKHSIPFGGFLVKFIVGNGKQLKDRLQDFPLAWISDFVTSKILVVAVVDGNPIGAYGISGILNLTAVYIKKDYRRQKIGSRIREIAVKEARRRGIGFLIAELPFWYLDSDYGLLLFSKYGCKVVKHIKRHNAALIVTPLTVRGHLVYLFLRVAFSFVPDELLASFSEWIGKKTRGIRKVAFNNSSR